MAIAKAHGSGTGVSPDTTLGELADLLAPNDIRFTYVRN